MNPIIQSAAPILKMGVLRPDAEVVKTFSYDKYINAGEGVTIPAYTTTATTLLASSSLTETYTVDYTNYCYYILLRCVAIPTYSVSTVAKGRFEYMVEAASYELAEVPGGTMHGLLNSSLYVTGRNAAFYSIGTIGKGLYYSSGTALSIYSGAAYGVYLTPTAPAVSSGVITFKTPALMIRGSTSYLTSTYFNAITDIRYQWIIELYRHSKGTLNIDGWSDQTQIMKAIECAQSATGKLT